MRVYLDNNVLVDLELGKLNEEDFLLKPNTDYYYSDAHLGELLEARGNPKVSQVRRLELIAKLCRQNYICSGVTTAPDFLEKDCYEIYKLNDIPLRVLINKTIVQGVADFDKLRVEIGFDSKSFNNENPDRVLKIIDDRLQEKKDFGLMEYLYYSNARGRALYVTLMNIVDVSNYWKDTQTSHSDVARLCDASHAYSAQICDVLVTGDKKMRAKVKAVYSFLGVDTKIVSVDEFLKMQ